MTYSSQLDYLIGVLYETVLDPSRWIEALELCGQYVGGIDTCIHTIDKKYNIPIASVNVKKWYTLQAEMDYEKHYITIDPRFTIMEGIAVNQWHCCHHTFNQNFVDLSEFYQDFLLKNSVRYSMFAWVDDNVDDHTVMSVSRAVGQQPFDHSEQLAAQRFSGHLQRALRLQKHTQSLHTKAELGAKAIDALALSIARVSSCI